MNQWGSEDLQPTVLDSGVGVGGRGGSGRGRGGEQAEMEERSRHAGAMWD